MMILIVLGSQKFQFNRLLEYVDELISEQIINEKVIAQSGFSDYIPKNYEITPFFSQDEFQKNMSDADIIITHAGTGSIVTALKKHKKVIAVPRLKKFDEHVDDHQLQIIENFVQKDLLFSANDKQQLIDCIQKIKAHNFNQFESSNASYIGKIKEFLLND